MLLVVGSIGCRSSGFSSSHESRIRRLLFQVKYHLYALCENSCGNTAADGHEVQFRLSSRGTMLGLDSRCLLDGTAKFCVLQALLWMLYVQHLSHPVR